MTDEQLAMVKALRRATLPLGIGAKSFIVNMASKAAISPSLDITDKQDIFLRQLVYRFRRQMPTGMAAEDSSGAKRFTTLQWLAPELAKHGLLKNEGWVTAHADEADALFQNQALKTTAVMIAVLHPRAIDYITQAPVLVMGVMQGSDLYKQKERQLVAEKVKPLVERGVRLRELLAAFGLPVQLRALNAWALAPSRWRAIRLLAKVPPSTLAQAVPEKPLRQVDWLNALGAWTDTMGSRFNDSYKLATWAAVNLSNAALSGRSGDANRAIQNSASDLADFAGSHGVNFNEKWDVPQALAAAERWHAELALKSNEEKFFAQHGIGWRDPIDYGRFPAEMDVGNGLRVVALRSGEDVWLEGRAMHHCVSSYTTQMVKGGCRLFSVRRGDERLATFELRPDYMADRTTFEKALWGVMQIKGPCNAAPVMYAREAVGKFLEAVGGKEVDPSVMT